LQKPGLTKKTPPGWAFKNGFFCNAKQWVRRQTS